MFSIRAPGVAQLFFTMLSQLVTFHSVFTKRLLRQACLEKGQFKESHVCFLSWKLSQSEIDEIETNNPPHDHRLSRKKCDLGQKDAGQRCMISEFACMIGLLQSPGTYKFLKIL